ncbi:KinB signaling pathway activation protein [Pullulanibacillus pueri]|nr:KinB-signaling pathway activation protein [Pullulanibacillus pueri]MBM7683094.1 KinB signaling pathway activation protein [Pullulanibacillus pueri]
MSIQKWISLFIRTLVIGCIVGLVVGVIVEWETLSQGMSDGHVKGAFIDLFIKVVLGGLFSMISQMGFFAYLTLHRIMLGIFRSHSRWGVIQLLLILFVFFDFVYLRYSALHSHGESLWEYIIPPAILLVISLIVAEMKKRDTNKIAYIPTLFFMFVVTTLEWLPDLRQKDNMFWVMGLTLIACNAYQILKLHRLLKETK